MNPSRNIRRAEQRIREITDRRDHRDKQAATRGIQAIFATFTAIILSFAAIKEGKTSKQDALIGLTGAAVLTAMVFKKLQTSNREDVEFANESIQFERAAITKMQTEVDGENLPPRISANLPAMAPAESAIVVPQNGADLKSAGSALFARLRQAEIEAAKAKAEKVPVPEFMRLPGLS